VRASDEVLGRGEIKVTDTVMHHSRVENGRPHENARPIA